MKFSVANDRIMSLKEYFLAAVKGKLEFKDFWAFKDVSFHVDKGDVVGIIGKNGAGKSTLLKIISGVLTPTEGNVTVNGNIVPMLELGSGFDFELSGRENIFLNGAILGYDKNFLEEKYDEILEFSELGDFIENPIRNYSSGMLMRLAFSIATIVKPEILIVDEILAVGDEAFQKKSKRKMLQMMGEGTTVLFVSHSIGQIREMCNKVAWLDGGKLRMFGDTKTVCDAYQEYMNPEPTAEKEKEGLYRNTVDTVCKDVLFVYGKREENYYWRVAVEREKLLSVGIQSGEVYHLNIEEKLISQFRAFVFTECDYSEKMLNFIKEIKKQNKVVMFDMISEKDTQNQLLNKCEEYIDYITVTDKSYEKLYSHKKPVTVYPYVANDRLLQLSTWALYDRDTLPKIDTATIDSDDMQINYNKATQKLREWQSDNYRIICLEDELFSENAGNLRKKISERLVEKNGKLIIHRDCDCVEFADIKDRLSVCNDTEYEDKIRHYAMADLVIYIKGEAGRTQREKLLTDLVKTKLCIYDIESDSYELFDDLEKNYQSTRSNASINSGIVYANQIKRLCNENYCFLTNLSEEKMDNKIIELMKNLKDSGKDVIIINQGQYDKKNIDEKIKDIPIINRSEKYIFMTFDNLIATDWSQYEYLLGYKNAGKKLYYVDKIVTDRFDDGDYSKFRANQTYIPNKEVIVVTDKLETQKILEDKFENKTYSVEMITEGLA